MTRTVTRLTVAVCLGLTIACSPAGEPDAHAPAPASAADVLYQCSMHPQVIRTEPGSCPICGMTLQRVERSAANATGHGAADHAVVAISPARQQLIGVTRATVARRPLVRTLRAAGRIANDAALYQLLVEHREAMRTRAVVGESITPTARAAATRLVDATRLKLRRAGIDDEALRILGALDPATLILPGRHVWLYAEVFEDDAPLLRPGMAVTVEPTAFPGRRYDARVVAVDPTVDPGTRTVRVRALVPTPEADLRPDSFATATFEVPFGDALSVPRDALLLAGTRRIAFVIAGDDRFEPREVTVGRGTPELVEVLAGLADGEIVVASANFLIDSESRLRAALEAFGHPSGGHTP